MGRRYKLFTVTRKRLVDGEILIDTKQVKVECDQVSHKKNCKVSHNPCIFNDYNTTLAPEDYKNCIYYKEPMLSSRKQKATKKCTKRNRVQITYVYDKPESYKTSNFFERHPNAKIIPSSSSNNVDQNINNKSSLSNKDNDDDYIVANKKTISHNAMIEKKEKEALERKLNAFKNKPCAYTVHTSESPSSYSKQYEHNMDKMWYDDPDIVWKKENWAHAIEVKTVYVFNSFLWCAKNKHNIDYIKAIITSCGKQECIYEAKFIFCKDCQKYYIDNTQYKNMRKNGIFPNFRIKPITIGSGEGYYSNFRDQSELSLYGYNAQKTTSTEYRERILYNIISNKLMGASEVVSFLQGLISLHEYNDKMEDAINCYEHDIMYIKETFRDREDYYYYYNIE